MSRYYRHLIEDGKLLDIYPNAVAAYSLRLLRSGYTGPLINIRRTVDSQNQDFFPLSNGELDWNAVMNFIGYNALTFSEDLTQTAYVKTRLTVSADSLQAPDGNMTADTLLETAVSGTHSLTRTFGIINGSTYTVSFWVKTQGRDFIRIVTPSQFSQNPGTSGVAWIDISNGTIISQNSGFINGPDTANLTVTADVNGWYKMSYTMPATITSPTPSILQVNLSPDGSTLTYVGDTALGVAFWGFQISETDEVKPYQATTTTVGGEGRLRIWYDQSVEGRDAVASGAATLQFILAQRGRLHLNADTGKPSILFQSTGSYTVTAFSATQDNSMMIGAYRWVTSNFGLFGNNSVDIHPLVISHAIVDSNPVIRWRISNNAEDHIQLPSPTGTLLTTTNRNGLNREMWVNNNQLFQSTDPLVGGNSNITRLGSVSSAANPSAGEWMEMIYWNENYTALRSAITSKINEYYGIY
jgi:hypothetical protein